MSSVPALALAMTLALAPSSSSSPSPAAPSSSSPTVESLEASLQAEPLARGIVVELASDVGPRPTGSPGYLDAVGRIEDRFKSIGLAKVHREKFGVRGEWLSASTRLSLLGAHPRPLAGIAAARGGSFVDAEAEVVIFPLDAAAVAARAPEVKGKIVLAQEPTPDAYPEWKRAMRTTAAALEKAGAVALLVTASGTPKVIVLSGDMKNGGVPVVLVDHDDATALAAAVAAGHARAHLRVNAVVALEGEGHNVAGEVPGRGRGVVIVHGHLDTVYGTPGARDDAAGIATIMEAMRALQALPPPRRTIRAVIFGGEEIGYQGSRAYAAAHAGELGDVVATVSEDFGAAPTLGFTTYGRRDLAAAVAKFATVADDDKSSIVHSDNVGFALRGVPGLEAVHDTVDYRTRYLHRALDTVDGVDGAALERNAAQLAVLLWHLADDEKPAAPHLDAAASRKLVESDAVELEELGAKLP